MTTKTKLSAKAIEARTFIEEQVKNKICVVKFIKADGSLRRLRGQYGVHVGVKGTGHEMPEHLLKMYDHDEKREERKFKSINLEKIVSIDCGELHWDNGSL